MWLLKIIQYFLDICYIIALKSFYKKILYEISYQRSNQGRTQGGIRGQTLHRQKKILCALLVVIG